jgi:hypothetical protein
MALQFNQYVPVGYINSVTPQSATIKCGYVVQDATVETNAGEVGDTVQIPFQAPTSWSGSQWTTDENGLVFTCQTTGIYSINVTQNLTMQNIAELANPLITVTVNIISPTTSEFNKFIQTTLMVPVTTDPITVQVNFSGIANVDVNSTLYIEVYNVSGNIPVTSNSVVSPNPNGSFSWNLIAEGEYGNTNVIV